MSAQPPTPSDGQPGPLCPKSGEAVDALVEKGFDLDAVDAEHRQRCTGLSRLLARLRHEPVPCCCADESVKRTMERIAAVPPAEHAERYDLCDADADAFELLVSNGWDARRVPSAVRARAERQLQLLAMLDGVPAEVSVSTDHLVRAAVSRIESESVSQSRRMRIHEPAAAERRSFRLTDIGAIAAMLLVAVSVAWPALANVRQRAQQTACFGGLGAIGSAVKMYGGDNNDSLPMATASLAGSKWWNVGQPAQSNSANLFVVAKKGYVKPQQLACRGNGASKDCGVTDSCDDWHSFDQVSYSYQNMFARERPRLDAPGDAFVVLADRNPAVLRAFRGERVIYVNENSPNHRGEGQNLLYSDGHAEWATSPVVRGDNIWLPRSLEDLIARVSNGQRPSKAEPLKGIEEPAKADAFLCP